MRQIIEILCTLCPMEDIPEIVRLINDKEVPFDMAKTPDQFGGVIIRCQYNVYFLSILKLVLNVGCIMLNRVSVKNDRMQPELLQEFNFPLLPQCRRKGNKHLFRTGIQHIVEH